MRRIEADWKSLILVPSTERSVEASRQSITGFLAEAFFTEQVLETEAIFFISVYKSDLFIAYLKTWMIVQSDVKYYFRGEIWQTTRNKNYTQTFTSF